MIKQYKRVSIIKPKLKVNIKDRDSRIESPLALDSSSISHNLFMKRFGHRRSNAHTKEDLTALNDSLDKKLFDVCSSSKKDKAPKSVRFSNNNDND